jgi:hypothetical protein
VADETTGKRFNREGRGIPPGSAVDAELPNGWKTKRGGTICDPIHGCEVYNCRQPRRRRTSVSTALPRGIFHGLSKKWGEGGALGVLAHTPKVPARLRNRLSSLTGR